MSLCEVLLYFSFFTISSFSNSFPTEALHDHMTEIELAHYFQTLDKNSIPEYEIVYLPVILPVREAIGEYGQSVEEIDYNFSAFKRPINLRLKRNTNLLSPAFKTYITQENGVTTNLPHPTTQCHYLHRDGKNVAAISICQPKSLQGIILLENATLEIHPLTERLQSVIRLREPIIENSFLEDLEEKVPHIIKRAALPSQALHPGAFPIITDDDIYQENNRTRKLPAEEFLSRNREAASHRPVGGMTVELAVFFDEAAFRIFAPYMGNDDSKLQDMLLAYMNGVQALYHHPSLGLTLEIVIVRLDIMKRQPQDLPHYNGERGKLLDSFCDYQQKVNPPEDSNPEHWDMALYVSGLDFYAIENGRRSGVTMGLATVGGVCYDKYACVIAELGTTNVFGKPYPSAGFTSVYIAAHEIGHNLGMHHDGTGNSCPKEGFVMSPSRGTNGETQWSSCSADIMYKLSWAKCLQDSAKPPKHLDHGKFYDNPGQVYTAKKQCEILLIDKDAIVSPNQQLSTICYNLQCKTPHRSGYYFAGPALEGTQCGKGKYCFGGECVDKVPPKPMKEVEGGWGPWKDGQCSSACIEKSKGHQMKRRFCNKPTPINTDAGCEGSSVQFGLCEDKKICKTKKLPVVDYASKKCKEFSKLIPELDKKGSGLQAPHEDARVWMGCAIFCRRADSGSFYTPRIELNDLGVSPYFPDGTWCHKQEGTDYFCLHHHCLPENFQFTKSSSFLHGIGEDMPFSQNAHPLDIIPPSIQNYLSLNPDGKPILKVLHPTDGTPNEEDWETDDYIEVPEIKERHSALLKEAEFENELRNLIYKS